eukprot:365632-Chlamydomonas_euryale.AAC.23
MARSAQGRSAARASGGWQATGHQAVCQPQGACGSRHGFAMSGASIQPVSREVLAGTSRQPAHTAHGTEVWYCGHLHKHPPSSARTACCCCMTDADPDSRQPRPAVCSQLSGMAATKTCNPFPSRGLACHAPAVQQPFNGSACLCRSTYGRPAYGRPGPRQSGALQLIRVHNAPTDLPTSACREYGRPIRPHSQDMQDGEPRTAVHCVHGAARCTPLPRSLPVLTSPRCSPPSQILCHLSKYSSSPMRGAALAAEASWRMLLAAVTVRARELQSRSARKPPKLRQSGLSIGQPRGAYTMPGPQIWSCANDAATLPRDRFGVCAGPWHAGAHTRGRFGALERRMFAARRWTIAPGRLQQRGAAPVFSSRGLRLVLILRPCKGRLSASAEAESSFSSRRAGLSWAGCAV